MTNKTKSKEKTANPLPGAILVTGEPGSGKTALALSHPVSGPEEFGILNFDGKEYPPLKWGFYKNYYGDYIEIAKSVNAERDVTEDVLKDLRNLPDSVRILIFDAGEMFKSGLMDWTMRNAAKLKTWQGGGTMLALSKRGYAKVVETSFWVNLIENTQIETVYIINHLKDQFEKVDPESEKSIKTGLRIPRSSDVAHQKAVAQFWVEKNHAHPCPITAVLKAPGTAKFDNGRIVSAPLLPPRLDPVALGTEAMKGHITVWDIINHYVSIGGPGVELKEYEEPTPEQFAFMKGTMTEGQKRAWEQRVALALSLKHADGDGKLRDEIKQLKTEGLPIPIIVTKLKESGYEEISIPKVKKIYDSL